MKKLLIGFGWGFVATLAFHQIAVAILDLMGLAPFGAWNMTPTPPFGVPAVLSLSFWGGLWGVVLVLVHHHFGTGARYYVSAFLFGGIVTSAVALLVVVPLKGGPVGGGWAPSLLLFVFIVNGVWGLTTALLVQVFVKPSATGQMKDTTV